MTTGIEAAVGRVVGQLLTRWGRQAANARNRSRLRHETRPLVATQVADQAIAELDDQALSWLSGYLDSPDFEHIVLQVGLSWRARQGESRLMSEVREELRQSLRHAAGIDPEQLYGLTDVVFDSLVSGWAIAGTSAAWPIAQVAVAGQAHVATMATRNSRLLARIPELTAYHDAAAQLRAQVAALHAELRLPHTGTSRSAPWSQLYVEPTLTPDLVHLATLRQEMSTEPGSRTVILGDPGAGKSTLAAKLAYDVATSEGSQVPFLLVLRNLPTTLPYGDRTLADHLSAVAREPYHVQLSSDTIEYLLMNGRSVVILDGLDELTDVALRRRIVELIEGFVQRYPLVPMIVTSRRVGYADTPLSGHLFRTWHIAPFDEDEVRVYAHNWFALDDSTAPADQDRLRDAFLRESGSISDLRQNPLLLSLLCATYAAEQHLPRNRAQVYERCAVLLFERWDSMRGVPMPLAFQGHVRGAVQELAWQMLAERDVSELHRHRVAAILTDYLRAKRFDADEAQGLAEQFLAFCTGRAWVLAEVGATDIEPLYGFAHRTFMEYFAAEHLVRHHPSAERTWAQLARRLADPSWAVVAQLGVQLLDRNIDNGAEDLVELALTGPATDSSALAAFLARTTAHVALSPATVARIVDAAVDCARTIPIEQRHRFFMDESTLQRMVVIGEPLRLLLYDSLTANVDYVQQGLHRRLDADIAAGDGFALPVLHLFVGAPLSQSPRGEYWWSVRDAFREPHRDTLADWSQRSPWPSMWRVVSQPSALPELVARFGPAPFYESHSYLTGVAPSTVCRLLIQGRPVSALPGVHVLRDELLRQPASWLPAERWYAEWRAAMASGDGPWELDRVLRVGWPTGGEDLASFLILFLPYAETYADEGRSFSVPVGAALDALMLSRVSGTLDNWHALDRIPPRYRDFLARWAHREFSVIG